jgi:hypothetical protein
MNIVALDLSLTATGFACSDGRSGVLEPKSLRGMARVTWILDRIDTLTEHADLTVVEGYAFGAKGSAVFDIAELGGVVRFHLFDHKRAYCDVPQEVRDRQGQCEERGRARRRGEAARLRGIESQRDRRVFLLEMARAHYTGTAKNQAQREAIGKVQWPVLSQALEAAS